MMDDLEKERVRRYLLSKTAQIDTFKHVDTINIVKMREGTPDIPKYETKGSAGLDLRADLSAYPGVSYLSLYPCRNLLVDTGLKVEIPVGYEGQVRSRSGLALKHGVVVFNSPGTIDSDYRGEVKIILMNFGDKDFIINHGDRIAQLVISPVVQLPIRQVNYLSDTVRGSGGFGHTGVK